MIPGDMLVVAILAKVNYYITNWNLQIDLCFYFSEIKPTSLPSKQISAGRRGGLFAQAVRVGGVSTVIMRARLMTGYALPR